MMLAPAKIMVFSFAITLKQHIMTSANNNSIIFKKQRQI